MPDHARAWNHAAVLMLAAAGVVVVVVAVTVGSGGNRRPTSTPPAPPRVSSGPSPIAISPAVGFLTSVVQLDFVDATHAWWITVQGRVMRTADAGRTWSEVSPRGLSLGTVPKGGFVALDADRAWVYSSRGGGGTGSSVFRTVDGGRTWSQASAGPAAVAAPIFPGGRLPAAGLLSMASPTSGLLLVNRGAGGDTSLPEERMSLYRTGDGGASWTVVAEPATAGDPTVAPVRGVPVYGDKLGIVASNAQTAWMTVSGVHLAWLFVTHDGGVDWQNVNLARPVNSASSIEVDGVSPPRFMTGADGYVDAVVLPSPSGGFPNAVYVTHDGGATWTGRLLDPQSGPAQALGNRRGVSIGSDGTVYTTTDDWVHVFSSVSHPELAQTAEPHFISLQVGWVLVTDNIFSGAVSLWATSDGGATFSQLGL